MNDAKTIASWIGVDATSAPAVAYIYDPENTALARIPLPDLDAETLTDKLEPYLGGGGATAVICAGAPWLPPAKFPTVPSAPLAGLAEIQIGVAGLRVLALPGLQQKQPCGVMQGAETMIAGLLAHQPGFDGVSLTIGPTTAWAQISAGEIVSFQSFLTPELAEALAGPLGAGTSVSAPLVQATFDSAVDAMLSRPQNLGAVLAEIQATARLDAMTDDARHARLSGSLVGVEMSAARPYWLGQQVAIIGAGPLAALYHRALLSQGVQVQVFDRDTLMQAGLAAAFARYSSAR